MEILPVHCGAGSVKVNYYWSIPRGDYYFFSHKGGDYAREGNYLREAIIFNIAHWTSSTKYFVLFSL